MTIDLKHISDLFHIHMERLSLVSIHHDEEVTLKSNEFLIDLSQNPYEKIVKPEKKYDHCAILRDTIQDNVIRCKDFETNNIFIFDDIITHEQCDHIMETMNSYFDKKQYKIEKWEKNQNVNCIFMSQIKELDNMVYHIINQVIQKLNHKYDILCSGDSGYCYRKIYGPTRLHKDGIFIEKNKKYVPMRKIRNISIIIALNGDYEGGEFFFPRQNKKIKLEKAHIIAFPPYWTHTHMTYPLLNNTYRYTINTWLYE